MKTARIMILLIKSYYKNRRSAEILFFTVMRGFTFRSGRAKIMNYREKAVSCVRDTVMPVQRVQFEECGCSLDKQYQKYGNTETFFARIIEPGHVYEVGYPKCVCEDVLTGKVTDPAHCECSRNSILYILQNLLPEKDIRVEVIHTVLGGADNCRFKVTVL